MPKKSKIGSTQAQLRKYRDRFSKIWDVAWPPRIKAFKTPGLTLQSVSGSSRLLQSIVAISFIGVIISLIFITFGIFNLFTVEEASEGGYVREVAINSSLDTFNPVLDLGSDAEQRVSELLYHPLYYVEYPDFTQNALEDPVITPVLLSEEPQWQDANNPDTENRFKTLQFSLKEDLKWSDDSALTVDDVKYSFDRLKEAQGNTQFKALLQNVTFNKVNDTQFQLISSIANPQLRFTSNFSPVSKEYYSSQNTARLFTDPKSSKPTVTSGYYTFTDEDVDDPDTAETEKVANPIKNSETGNIDKVILNKNQVNNYREPQIDTYVFHSVDGVFDSPNTTTLENLAQSGEVDLFSRLLGTNLDLAPSALADKTGLEQQIVPTNTFYTVNLNIRSGEIFVNQTLRRYVICKLLTFTGSSSYNEFLTPVPNNKAITPLQLGNTSEPDCPTQAEEALDDTVYSFRDNAETGSRELLIFGLPTSIQLVSVGDSGPLLTDLVNFFTNEIGIPAEVTNESQEAEEKLASKEYNVAFLPITYVSKDLNPIYGASGRDISEIRRNRRVDPDTFEANLLRYDLSNYQDEEARQELVDFFNREYISLNMYQLNQEYNYSDRIINLSESIPDLHVFNTDLYKTLPEWFTNTKRSLK